MYVCDVCGDIFLAREYVQPSVDIVVIIATSVRGWEIRFLNDFFFLCNYALITGGEGRLLCQKRARGLVYSTKHNVINIKYVAKTRKYSSVCALTSVRYIRNEIAVTCAKNKKKQLQ